MNYAYKNYTYIHNIIYKFRPKDDDILLFYLRKVLHFPNSIVQTEAKDRLCTIQLLQYFTKIKISSFIELYPYIVLSRYVHQHLLANFVMSARQTII